MDAGWPMVVKYRVELLDLLEVAYTFKAISYVTLLERVPLTGTIVIESLL